ncbi:MAG: GDP-mannose 4,6-dehydratase, partial [Proteobacteria bacterium]|nr:GDP-mannose 4,6-dehydratase [Pseudomonadota bacterium]
QAHGMFTASSICFNHCSPRRGETFVTRKITRAATRIRMGLQDKLSRHPRTLSHGERQRVAICRALSVAPRLLIADEPTGNLDTARSLEIMELLTSFNQDQGITIVMVTHEQTMAQFARRVVQFQDGLVVTDRVNGEMR